MVIMLSILVSLWMNGLPWRWLRTIFLESIESWRFFWVIMFVVDWWYHSWRRSLCSLSKKCKNEIKADATNLSWAKVASFVCLFTYVGLKCFGPFEVTVGSMWKKVDSILYLHDGLSSAYRLNRKLQYIIVPYVPTKFCQPSRLTSWVIQR